MSIVAKKIMMGSGAVALPSDSEFNRTSFLSHFDGENNGVNNQFTDGSASNHTITANGDVTQGSFGPFARPDGEWAVAYNQSGNDYFAVPDSTDFNVASGADWTLEFWGYYTNVAANNQIVDTRPSGSNGFYFTAAVDTNKKVYFFTNSGYVLTTAASININEWVHIAFVRSSGTLKIYINGTADSNTYSDSNTYISGNWWIGTRQSSAGSWTYGSMSNFRFVNGTAVYTSNFTPSTSKLTAITNTKLLTFQSNRFVDNSASAHTITPAGDVSVSAFGPFLTSAVYDPAVNGASAYFDGTGDWLDVNDGVTFGTGAFTIEFFVYVTPASGGRQFFESRPNTQGVYPAIFIINDTLYYYVNSGNKIAGGTFTKNAWHHVAVCRSGTSTKMFLDGKQVGSTYSDSNNYLDGGSMRIGATFAESSLTPGYFSDVRVVNSAVYTSNFTPPTAPVTAITNTQLLLNMADGQAIDSAAQNNLTLYGNANTSTDQAKFGDTSLHLDGTGDYVIKYAQDISGTGAFTVEMFLRLAAVGAVQVFYDTRPGGTNGKYPMLFVNSNNTLNYYVTTNNRITSSETLSANTWYHIALCRSGTSTKLFLNGTQVGSTYSDSHNYVDSGQTYLGRSSFADEFPTNGFIDEIRFSKMARYTSNFTAPSEPFADKGQ